VIRSDQERSGTYLEHSGMILKCLELLLASEKTKSLFEKVRTRTTTRTTTTTTTKKSLLEPLFAVKKK